MTTPIASAGVLPVCDRSATSQGWPSPGGVQQVDSPGEGTGDQVGGAGGQVGGDGGGTGELIEVSLDGE